ncbi:MAG: PAS domain S-box protein, partial [Candidatus Omnitrophica bacterium]|nr:PAS domain S-box protein [Candidatus Omnitrophota bacterium]
MERSKSLLPINNFLENQLRESEAKYRSLVEQIPAVTYIAALDNTSTTLYVSPQIVEISGYDPDDYMKDPGLWDKHIYPEDHDKVLAERISSRVSGRPFKAEYRVFEGKPLFLQGIVFNITELRSAEEERKKAEANLQKAYAELETKIKERTFKLAEREEFLSNIFDSIQDGLSILDKEMNIIRVNETMEKWYEHSMPLVGKKCYQAYHGIKVPCKTCPTCRTLESGIS